MKGGITSGVVYPFAVAELANRYRLKSIGGTSAGAIAAAVAAAAEHGRAHGGYAHLTAIPVWLKVSGNLKRLFQPHRSHRAVFRLLMAFMEHGAVGRFFFVPFVLLRWFTLPVLLGAAPGAAALAFAVGHDGGLQQVLGIIAAALTLLIGMGVGVGVRVWVTWKTQVPTTQFGLCTGMPTKPGPLAKLPWSSTAPPALTPWLALEINKAAGRPDPGLAKPLTFGELWAGPDGTCKPDMPDYPHVRLEMVSTNVTLHALERLPQAGREYFFDPEEFRALFPESVVNWMLDNPRPLTSGREREQELRRHLALPRRPMPAAENLPVIVATRMSLAFPVLLSAVPLWRVDFTQRANQKARAEWPAWLSANTDWRLEDDAGDLTKPSVRAQKGMPAADLTLERCWFSDGGICSNFPVHFFDKLLPSRPTFAINLRPFPSDTAPAKGESPPLDETKNVSMVDSVFEEAACPPFRFDGQLGGFLSNVLRTMQNRVDEAQMRTPGYRDRIVHVHLTKDEGGMNLNMPPAVIEALIERGRVAGQKLVARFDPATPPADPKALSWDAHRWVRLRTSFAATSTMLAELSEQYAATPPTGQRSYPGLIARAKGAAPNLYPLDSGPKRAAAVSLMAGVDATIATTDADKLLDGSPKPPPVLGLRPEATPAERK